MEKHKYSGKSKEEAIKKAQEELQELESNLFIREISEVFSYFLEMEHSHLRLGITTSSPPMRVSSPKKGDSVALQKMLPIVALIKKHHYRNPIVAFCKNTAIGLSIDMF